MPAKSKAQQTAAAIARAAKKGKIPVEKLRGASKSMYESMTKKQLGHFAKTERKGLPERVKKSSDAFAAGFAAKCAEAGVNPETLIKAAGGWQALWQSLQRGGKAFGKGFKRTLGVAGDALPWSRELEPAARLALNEQLAKEVPAGGKQLLAYRAGQAAPIVGAAGIPISLVLSALRNRE